MNIPISHRKETVRAYATDTKRNCCALPQRHVNATSAEQKGGTSSFPPGRPANVIRVCGGRSFVGTNAPKIPEDGEGPERAVVLTDFALEAETVTVRRFAEFIEATGYVTEAERFGWSAVFFGDADHLKAARAAGAELPWWHRVDGACWRQPEGPGSCVDERQDHPVTQVSWNDAIAFATWVGGRLPSEAEWEHAARGGSLRRRFPWGDKEPDDTTIFCNIWQGRFPEANTVCDGYERTAPVRSFEPNDLGFYNMCGNVWEWTKDAFRLRSISRRAKERNAQALARSEKVLKGGSFLCHASYCYRYRIAARMALSPDSAASNVGFRVTYEVR
ncbi:formylglycine-generating enzyme family protein [Chelativorans sp. AA-79]|uniref:formylglycine-generating enzyme family protein n=1 Tax=Chelativorans sp. AA-79 TaxID=3028735 RepID=UPI0023F7A626|nr:formylglycine-generating enzyme family protein [Chelativorans sp. AA-79]WEX12296.1 formylglycine-generating enzyme family protein [Chelativorans sp. AA-79]